MDVLVRKRTPLRSSFTKLYNKLVNLFEEETVKTSDIEVKLASLERIKTDLSEIDEQILDSLLADETKTDAYNDEYETIEQYKEKYDDARVRANSILQNAISRQESENLNVEKQKLKLPKIELMKFGGEVKDWLSFWSQFSRIHEDKHMESEDKFQYLIQCMASGTRAKEIIDSYPPTAENYLKAVESLQSRFGREELLIEFYVRELLGLVVKNATNMKSKTNIMQLYDKLESHLRSLESIGMTSDKYAAMLFPLVESCIPEDILRVWLRNPSLSEDDKSYSNKLSQLLLFLRAEVEGEERINLAKSGIKHNDSSFRKQKCQELEIAVPTASDLFVSSKIGFKIKCVFCDKTHQSKDCFYGQKLSHEEKLDLLKSKKCCYSCLKIGHLSKNCKSNVRCMLCDKRHFIIMCPEFKQKPKIPPKVKNEEDNVLSNMCSSAGEVYLQTLVVGAVIDGKKRPLRALIDSGSQRSYILKSTAKELKLTPHNATRLTHIVFGGERTLKDHECFRINVCNLHTSFCCELSVLDQKTICGNVPSISDGLFTEELRKLGITITDVNRRNTPIEILIGADFAGKLYTGKIYNLNSGLTAVETHLGWVLMGKSEIGSTLAAVTLLRHSDNLTKLWELETIGIKDPHELSSSKEIEEAVTEHFKKTVTINSEGRYEIKLPWKEVKNLPDNKIIAERRLDKLTSKLISDGNYEAYNSIFLEWLENNIIEKVPAEELTNPSYHFPHRGVFKENSTTKLRPVFDASSRQKGSPSLNDCLEKGANTIELIPEVLLKFREKKIGLIADIKKAFLQISICKEDRDYLRFLWWEDVENKKLQVFRHRRVVFGVTCSPFILGIVIQYHLENINHDKDIAEKLRKTFYVDNCITSVDSEGEMHEFVKVSTELMAEAKLELRGWECTEYNRTGILVEPTSVLGLLWDRYEDTLFCDVSSVTKPKTPITRRILLSLAQKIFDPIGFSSPVTLFPKLLLQESWKSKLSWDAEISKELEKKFINWLDELHLLTRVKIPRYILIDDDSSISLHTFCDASGLAYASVVYIRSKNAREVKIRLVLAKSRIAPLKKMSIPRLELMACNIGIRLSLSVKKALGLTNVKEFFWTDSSTALHWIHNQEPWTVFVQNRVKEIRTFSNVQDWKHIPGSENPADLPSRGCSVKKLIDSHWWEGPSWLKKEEDQWPKSDALINQKIFTEMEDKSLMLLNTTVEKGWYLTYFSSCRRIIRMVAWIIRFITNSHKTKENRMSGDLSTKELLESERKIVSLVQKESFTEKYLSELKSISHFKDLSNIIRVKTKLTERRDFENFKTPILLPSKHKWVELYIQERHLELLHCGLNALLMDLRENFWIINARKTVRKVIEKCIRCKRHTAKAIKTIPVALPEDRIRDASVFEICGVDLAGPLILKGGVKIWIVLYTCAIFRAVHLELVQSLSTKAFLFSLRRFIARRGRPRVIYSDNGTNFVGTNNLFNSIDWKVVEVEASFKKITWKLNPPTAAWWGGFWERLIQSVKKVLRRVLGKASLTHEEMSTLICDCESIINARPITYISENPDDLQPLTPAMFLQPIQEAGVPDLDHIDKVNLTKRIQYQQRLRENLRQRFRTEYLGQLLLKRSSKLPEQSIKIGDIVLIENVNQKRAFWPLGRVIHIYPGKDGNNRLVRLKTAYGELLRPVQRTYSLEIQASSNSSEKELTEKEAENELIGKEGNIVHEVLNGKITRSGRNIKTPAKFKDYEL